MFCRNCGKELTGTPEICLGCGARPLAGNSFCQGCGAETNALAEICLKCGVRLGKAKGASMMQKISPTRVLLLGLITLGIYMLVWHVTIKDQMNASGADIPSAWHLIIPIVNLIWLWKFSQGVEMVTDGGMSAGTAFLWMLLLGLIGRAIVQSELNKVAT